MKLFEAMGLIGTGEIEGAEKDKIVIVFKREAIVNKKTGRAIRADNIMEDGWEEWREPHWYDVLTERKNPILCGVVGHSEFVLVSSFSIEDKQLKVLGKEPSEDRYFNPEELEPALLEELEPFILDQGKKTKVTKTKASVKKDEVKKDEVKKEPIKEEPIKEEIVAEAKDKNPAESKEDIAKDDAPKVNSKVNDAKKKLSSLGDLSAKNGKSPKELDEVHNTEVDSSDVIVVETETLARKPLGNEEVTAITIEEEAMKEEADKKTDGAEVSNENENKTENVKKHFAMIGVRGSEKWDEFIDYCKENSIDPLEYDFSNWKHKQTALKVVRMFLAEAA